jgi:predicted nuclease of predicted toxin-antitoxin system
VKILLDENFPLGLVRALQAEGLDVDHIITSGIRGASDARIRERLSDPQLIFMTLVGGSSVASQLAIARLRNSQPE